MKPIQLAHLGLTVLTLTIECSGQSDQPLTKERLSEITRRGRLIAEYDQASSHATDAVRKMRVRLGESGCYIAEKLTNGWRVSFGQLSDDQATFLVNAQADPAESPLSFRVTEYRPAKDVTGFLCLAARALSTSVNDFGTLKRPYNSVILPTSDNQFWVYLIPAPLVEDITPLGGDVRYLLSTDGKKILEKRKLHNSIIEAKPPKDPKVQMGTHTHVLHDVPEDTDVFYVLTRKPSLRELIVTPRYAYLIEQDGEFSSVGTKDDFLNRIQKTKP